MEAARDEGPGGGATVTRVVERPASKRRPVPLATVELQVGTRITVFQIVSVIRLLYQIIIHVYSDLFQSQCIFDIMYKT